MNRLRTPSRRVLWLVLGIAASIGIGVGAWLSVWAPPRRLSDAMSSANPRWSPTGAYVLADCAFHLDSWGFDGVEAYEVCLAQPDLSGLVRLAPNYTHWTSLEATWSPDGTEVVFLNPQGGLLVSSVQPNTTRLLTSTPCEAPDWSPDGRQISCIDNDHNLVLVHVGTGAITRLTTMGDVFTPHWARDGQAIAFVKAAGIGLQRYDVYDLYVLDLLTQQEHRLMANLGALPPMTISPDGTQLAYPNAPAPGLGDRYAQSKRCRPVTYRGGPARSFTAHTPTLPVVTQVFHTASADLHLRRLVTPVEVVETPARPTTIATTIWATAMVSGSTAPVPSR